MREHLGAEASSRSSSSYEAIFSEKPMPANGCKHSYGGICAIVFRGKESGYVSRCLLCDEVGPARATTETARLAFLEEQRRNKK
jgi:hypothetical protein